MSARSLCATLLAMTSHLDAMAVAHTEWLSRLLTDWYPASSRLSRSRDAMRAQAEWIGDETFGTTFRNDVDTVPVPDPLAWANRRLDVPNDDWCVTGIRFRGRDVERPFVDVVATSVRPDAESLARVCDAVIPLYAEFRPRALRVDAPDPDSLVAELEQHEQFSGAAIDQYVVAGRVDELRGRARLPGYDRITVVPVGVPEAAAAVLRYYRQATVETPRLSEWASASTSEELQNGANEGLLREIRVDGRPAGVVSAHRDNDHGMTGFVVQEIVLSTDYRGRRLAAPTLQHLLELLPATSGDTLWGTIHPDNQASVRNARSIGREIVGGYVWITPTGLPGI